MSTAVEGSTDATPEDAVSNSENCSGTAGQQQIGIHESSKRFPSSKAASVEGADNVQAENDGYFTAHASVASLVPDVIIGKGNAAVGRKPAPANDTAVFIPMVAAVNSDISSSHSGGELCRICHGEGIPEMPLIAPCNCSGSMKFVHQECVQTWLKSSGSLSCELCRFTYLTGTKMEPLHKWRTLELTLLERWKVVCCVTIQLFAICYFILSTEALIRAINDYHIPQAALWFWIKISMSVFGITVSLACSVRQCRTFFRIFRRWHMYNKTIYVRDRSEPPADGPSAARALLGSSK